MITRTELDEIEAQMQTLRAMRDREGAHGKADDLLLWLVQVLATTEQLPAVLAITKAYSQIEKWYG